MKKILFLIIVVIALGYPALTIMAQEAAQDVLEEILVVEPEKTAQQPMDVPKVLTDEKIIAEAMIVETPAEVTTELDSSNTVVTDTQAQMEAIEAEATQAEAEPVERIVPRNPETEVIVKQEIALEPSTQELNETEVVALNTTSETISVQTTHPQLNLTEDKSEMIRLSEKAASVIVGNPNHISVLLDTPDTIIVVPRKPGASHFAVIGENGKVIMQRHAIVGAPKDDYVRIRRSCNAGDRNCQQTSVYYCPNTCHEVMENTETTRRR